MTLRVGVHPNNLHLWLAQRWPGAFDGADVAFVSYAEGRDSGELLLADRIDVCGTGSTPPILAQASGTDVLYLAASATRPANGGILIAPDSPIDTIEGLRGRHIALLDGSFQTYLLARALETAGLRLGDVARVELAPGAAARALAAGEVDAWVAMDPLLGQALAAGTARLLVPCGETIPNRSVFWTLRRRGLADAVLDGFVTTLTQLGRAIAAHPDQAAALLGGENLGGADAAAWRRAVASRDWRIVPADTAIIAEQQEEADTLVRHGDLPAPLALADAAR
jgi:NitT/TauT family transport system substrate-binding protein/sulfonate transport system substrate-binding protein